MRKVAPDRGYAWVVLAASVGCNYLSGVLVYFVGVIHVELLHKYHDDVTTTAWAGSIYSSLQMLAAPLSAWLVDRYSCRVSVVVGGVLLCVGFTASAFTTSVFQLVLTYGLIAGTGLGLTYSPSLMVITFYFEKFRSLASGISVSGCALGILSGSLLTQAFIDTYSLSGAFLLIAGLGLQSSVFGMLYRPTHHEGESKRRQKRSLDCDDKAPGETCGEGSASFTLLEKDYISAFNKTLLVSSEDLDPEQVISNHGYRMVENSKEKSSECKQSSLGCLDIKASDSTQDPETVYVGVGEEEGVESSGLLNEAEKRNTEISSSRTKSSRHKEPERNCPWRTVLTKFFNTFSSVISLMKNQAFVFHCISVCFANANMSGVYLHLPEYSRTLETKPTEAAALFVGVGLFSLASRIGSGLLLTSPRVNALVLSVGLMGLCGLSSCLFPFYSSTYVGQMTFACLFGLTTGGFYTLINVLTIQLVPLHVLAAAYGLLIFAMGIGYVAGPPLAGLIVDNGGTYEHSFLFLGLTMFASAAFDLLAKIIHTRKEKQSSLENKCQADWDKDKEIHL